MRRGESARAHGFVQFQRGKLLVVERGVIQLQFVELLEQFVVVEFIEQFLVVEFLFELECLVVEFVLLGRRWVVEFFVVEFLEFEVVFERPRVNRWTGRVPGLRLSSEGTARGR